MTAADTESEAMSLPSRLVAMIFQNRLGSFTFNG